MLAENPHVPLYPTFALLLACFRRNVSAVPLTIARSAFCCMSATFTKRSAVYSEVTKWLSRSSTSSAIFRPIQLRRSTIAKKLGQYKRSKEPANNVPANRTDTFKVALNEKPCRCAVISTLPAIYAAQLCTLRTPSSRTTQRFLPPRYHKIHCYATLEVGLRASNTSADRCHLENVFKLIPAEATLSASPAQFRDRTNAQRGHERPSLEMAVCSRQFGHTESPRS